MAIRKVLVANRGEIARRIFRTLRRMGIGSVAVYSEADENLPYVREADEAILIGKAPVSQSYLSQERILLAAKESGADAIHPGYGFLSENARFAKAVIEAGLRWIGPDPEVIAGMGDKAAARRQMRESGVPVLPGWEGDFDPDAIIEAANQIGYPVMIKASAGGGGIGMEKAGDEAELRMKLSSVQRKAATYFGDDRIYLEKALLKPRHVEVQILADRFGHYLHLFERDCSIQRRHQKVIEETPAPLLSEGLRAALYRSAIAAAEAVQYVGAGTVEFILEGDRYYFLEMNTRLQVEHPITEMITGIDLVEWQVRIARGEALPFTQDEISLHGHAMEFRIYAEDPVTYYPSPGFVSAYIPPQGEGIRVDDGIEAGNLITPYYDPLIAKLAVWGRNREEVLERGEQALMFYRIEGIKQNLPLHLKVVRSEAFRRGELHTRFLDEFNR